MLPSASTGSGLNPWRKMGTCMWMWPTCTGKKEEKSQVKGRCGDFKTIVLYTIGSPSAQSCFIISSQSLKNIMKDPQPLVCKSEDGVYHLCQRHRLPFFHVGRGGGDVYFTGWKTVSVAHLCLTHRVPMDCTHQAPLSLGFSRQEYWNRLPFPIPGDLPNPGIEPTSPALAGRSFTTEPPRKPNFCNNWPQIART